MTEFTTIVQEGPAANSIQNILRSIELPPGVIIDLYALVPDARHMYIHNCQRKAQAAPYYALISRMWRVFYYKQSARGRRYEDQRLF